jgi:RNA polymerase sigma factor (sigma-70 family)
MRARGPRLQSAIDELVARVYRRTGLLARRIFRVSFPRLGASHETGTVHHEALIRIRKALERSPPATVEEFWVLSTRIIRNTLIDLARRHDRSLVQIAGSIEGAEESGSTGKPRCEPATRDEPAENVESWTLMHHRVSLLPQPQREVFELCFYNGLNQREAAQILQRDPATISRLWRKAIGALPLIDL